MKRTWISALFTIGFLFFNLSQVWGYDSCVFYVQAHPDDWQLFRGEQVWKDIHDTQQPKKVVFIYTTAGDAGRRDGWWQAREEGARASVQVILPSDNETSTIRVFNGHEIQVYTRGNTISYFMRLPEAANDSNLKTLHESNTPLETIDNPKTTYQNWEDFVKTLRQLMDTESEGCSYRFLNVSDNEDEHFNPGDHLDHHQTSLAIQEAADKQKYQMTLYETYNVADKPANLGSEDYKHKKSSYFDGYVKTIREKYCNHNSDLQDCKDCCEKEWGKHGKRWGAKSYYRLRE